MVEAVQISVEQISQAFKHPNIEVNPSKVTDLIPFVDEKEKNNTPLFQVKDGKYIVDQTSMIFRIQKPSLTGEGQQLLEIYNGGISQEIQPL